MVLVSTANHTPQPFASTHHRAICKHVKLAFVISSLGLVTFGLCLPLCAAVNLPTPPSLLLLLSQ